MTSPPSGRVLAAGRAPGRYLRDGRAPIPRSEAVSRVMSANRGRGTVPERRLQTALRAARMGGLRANYPSLPGRPDLAFPGRKLAIFVNGCFWHRCPHCRPRLPQSHRTFWRAKFNANRMRDARKTRQLRRSGWGVLTVWECQIRENLPGVVGRIAQRWGRTTRKREGSSVGLSRSVPVPRPA